MIMTKVDKKQIVLETVEVYNDPNNRALFYTKGTDQDATCQYESSNGNRCAVGRCMTEMAIRRYGDCSRRFDKLTGIKFDKLLKEEYHGQTLQFWIDLQNLHDNHSHWSINGITLKGIKFVKDKFGVEI
jgi:hypothetical protein